MVLVYIFSYSFLGLIITQLVKCHLDSGNYITVFDTPDEKLNVSISQCSNLPENWTRRVSGISTNGFCARLFDNVKCEGNSIEILPASPSHNDLRWWRFNNRAMSVGPCRPECSTEVTGGLPNGTFQISLQSLLGDMRTIDVDGCAEIKPFNILGQIRTINFDEHCVQLYSNPTCNPHLGRNVELREGTPFRNNLMMWEMSRAKSISHCAYKCTNNKDVRLGDGDVVLFDHENFAGNFYKRNVRKGNCLDIIPSFQFGVMSIQVSNNTCVTLFDQFACGGESLDVKKSMGNLRLVQFRKKAMSLKLCGGNYRFKWFSPLFSILLLIFTVFISALVKWCGSHRNQSRQRKQDIMEEAA